MTPSIVWFRRDLRLRDLPTLGAVDDDAVALFVLDDALLRSAGAPRRTFLLRCLRALEADLDGRLLVVAGDPATVVPALARELGAGAVHISADHAPYGVRRDAQVEQALGSVPLIRTGSPYAVSPGRVRKQDGTPYKVFTPFRRAWLEHGWRQPAAAADIEWIDADGLGRRIAIPADDEIDGVALPPAGEAAALERWRDFLADGLEDYATERDRPDHDGTSRLSPYLKFGCVHPRTLLADLAGRTGEGATTLRSELAWRDFYADVLHHRPETTRANYNPRFDAIQYDAGPAATQAFEAWQAGRTGFPIVDAGMRQLLGEGWIHNRVRMIVASFLAKDLHLPWWWGARHFMEHLIDGDVASNQHGWQWVAGSGTDAAPYFRVFNPIAQGEKFDPQGDYVRRWVPELRGIAGRAAHKLPGGPPAGYPAPIVDHAQERLAALERYQALKPL